jgi:hypothetical protein
MSEERQLPEYDPETTPDPIATGIAISRASPAIDREVIAFLRDQRLHLHEQFRHLREQLRLRLWEQRMGVFLRVATAIVGTAVASGFALMVWDAAHSKGLIIEQFSVPPEMAERGLSGQVVAAKLLDRLAVLGTSESSRATQSYANNWGDNIKVEIPETGVSIGELQRFLRGWLGHDIHISGEVYRTQAGIAVTARAGDKGATFTGGETDLDSLVQKAAEHVFEITQPYRYANYLDRNYDPRGEGQRVAKATEIYRRLIAGDDRKEQAWAWNGLATIQFNFYGDNQKSSWYYRKALATDPDFTLGYYALGARNLPLGQEEDQYRNVREYIRRADLGTPELNPRYARSALAQAKGYTLSAVGDFTSAIPILVEGAERTDNFSVLGRSNFTYYVLSDLARVHDLKAMRAYLKGLGRSGLPSSPAVRIWYAMETGDWRSVLLSEPGTSAPLGPAYSSLVSPNITVGDYYPAYWPVIAYAHASIGDFAGAEAVIAKTQADNATAVRIRAMIAELKGEHARADWWFARSEAQTPSIPLTDLWWGQVLLKRGKPDAAIEKFKLANQKGPHFADPLEGWGEALMAQNLSPTALAKFAEANKYAPNWGRLHLKWGEALAYSGEREQAKAQFARAAQLDLTPSEKAELARHP